MIPPPPSSRSRAAALCVVCLVLGLSATARGAAPRVHLEVTVALASTKGSGVDPRLQKMARDFKAQNLSFTSFQVVGAPRAMDLSEGQSASVDLPTGAKAEVTFSGLERGGRAKVRVKVPLASGEYEIHAGGGIFVSAGSSGGGSLFVSIRR